MTVELLTQRIDVLHDDVNEIKQSMRSISDAVVTLARVEERQAQTASALERAFSAIESLEKRMSQVEKYSHDSRRIGHWVDLGVVGIVVIVAQYIFKRVGVL